MIREYSRQREMLHSLKWSLDPLRSVELLSLLPQQCRRAQMGILSAVTLGEQPWVSHWETLGPGLQSNMKF